MRILKSLGFNKVRLLTNNPAKVGALVRHGSHRNLTAASAAIAAVPILHSCVDFSLQMPAIAFMVSALLGMGWAQTFAVREKTKVRRSSRR